MALDRSSELRLAMKVIPSVELEMPVKGLFLVLVWWPFCSVAQNHFRNFGRGSFKEHFYEIILKLVHWP